MELSLIELEMISDSMDRVRSLNHGILEITSGVARVIVEPGSEALRNLHRSKKKSVWKKKVGSLIISRVDLSIRKHEERKIQ